MSLKILGGQLQGRILKTPKTDTIRPTKGILRQAVFNICQNEVEGSVFLDLFAGSGAMGIEALSRGATHASFLEKDKIAYKTILENLRDFHLEGRSNVLCGDVCSMLHKLKHTYSLVYIDPPYCIEEAVLFSLMNTLKEKRLLKKDALVFLETGLCKEKLEKSYCFDGFIHRKTRKCGKSLLSEYIFLLS